MNLSFKDFFLGIDYSSEPSLFLFQLVLATLYSLILSKVYVKFSNSLGNRVVFARSFFLLSAITLLVITVIRSSLALSLGMVGALSIVRFRAAIKDPEELLFIFFAMAIGIGFGANQTLVTSIGFFFIVLVYSIRQTLWKPFRDESYHLVLQIVGEDRIHKDAVLDFINENVEFLKLKRMEQANEVVDLVLTTRVLDVKQLGKLESGLLAICPRLKFSFLDLYGVPL